MRLTIHPNKFSTIFPRPGLSTTLIGAKVARPQGHFCGETGSPIWTPACRRPGPSVRASGSLVHSELIDSCRQRLDFFCLLARLRSVRVHQIYDTHFDSLHFLSSFPQSCSPTHPASASRIPSFVILSYSWSHQRRTAQSPTMDEEGQTNREANLKEAVRFWRAWKTVHQMCKDRVCGSKIPLITRHHAITFDVGCARGCG